MTLRKKDTVKFLGRFIESYKQRANVIAPVPVPVGRVETLVSHVELADVEVFRGRDWEEQSVEFMMNIYNIYIAQHATQKFHYGKASYENVVYSTLREDDPRYDAFDVVTMLAVIGIDRGQGCRVDGLAVGVGADPPSFVQNRGIRQSWGVAARPVRAHGHRMAIQELPAKRSKMKRSNRWCSFSRLPLPTRETTGCIS